MPAGKPKCHKAHSYMFKHFEGGLGPTRANPVPTVFDFPENLQRKEVKPRQDPQGRRLKNAPTTSKIRRQANVATRRLENVRIWWNSNKFIWKTMKVVQGRKP